MYVILWLIFPQSLCYKMILVIQPAHVIISIHEGTTESVRECVRVCEIEGERGRIENK